MCAQLLILVRWLTIYAAMHNAQQLGERGRRIVTHARERFGRVVVKPETLAALLGIWLMPHGGEPMSEGDALAEARSHDRTRVIQFRDDSHSQAVKERVIALACAAVLVEEADEDPCDRPLVEYVASAVCGLPRPLVSANASAFVFVRTVVG